MEAVTYSVFRNNLRTYLDKTKDDAEVLLVTSKDPESNVVVMNERDYESILETVRVMSNPYLSEKLARGMAEASSGQYAAHGLMED